MNLASPGARFGYEMVDLKMLNAQMVLGVLPGTNKTLLY